ncbi:hypothetical protein [Okeania sp. SIO3I5]|nr:hypothetical protein [Okeania sp. SIO3I5]
MVHSNGRAREGMRQWGSGGDLKIEGDDFFTTKKLQDIWIN